MRNLSLTAIITVILIGLFTGAEIRAQSAPNEPITDTAEVIYITRDRIYLNIGTLEGMNTDWQVRVAKTIDDTLVIPLSWCGEDISYFVFHGRPKVFIAIGDLVELNYQPSISTKNYSITLAYPRLPAKPHKTQVDIYDFEFIGSLNERVLYLMTKFEIDTTGENYDRLLLFTDSKKYRSDGKPVDKYDLGIAFPYLISDSMRSLDHYLLKKSIPSFNIMDGDTTLLFCYGDTNKALGLIRSINPYALHVPDDVLISPNDSNAPFNGDWNRYRTSTGPYYLAELNDDRIILLRNKYNSSYTIYPDTLIIKIIPDYLDRKLAFQLGQLDYLDINFTDKDQFQHDYKIMESETKLSLFLSANNSKDYLDDGILTTALSYFVNRESLCRVALGGMAEPLSAPPYLTSGRSVEPYPYNPQKGRELLRNAGDIPKYLSLYIKPDNFITRRTAEYIKGILARQNIYATIYSDKDFHPGPTEEQFEEFDLMLSYIDLSSNDPLVVMNQITFHHGMTDITANKSLYFADEYDSIAKDYLNDADTSKTKLLNYYQNLREIPSGIFLLKPKRMTVISNRLSDFEFKPDGTVDFSRIELSDESQK